MQLRHRQRGLPSHRANFGYRFLQVSGSGGFPDKPGAVTFQHFMSCAAVIGSSPGSAATE
jgi:hypothetical protein